MLKHLILTDAAIELLLNLLQINRDALSASIAHSFSPEVVGIYGRVPDEGDVRSSQDLKLTTELITMLKAECVVPELTN
jgi:hypothetical protein